MHRQRRSALWTAAASAAVALLPLATDNFYYLHIATLIAIYWVLISSLNLLVGYTGTLSVGHVGLLAIGAYAFCILTGGEGWPAFGSLLAGGAICALVGLLLGLPSLRLPGFYFAMVTTAFSVIVSELALAEGWLTNGSVGMPAPGFPAPFDTPRGFYALAALTAGLATWLSWNLARSMWGSRMVAVRDSRAASLATGIKLAPTKLIVFVFSGFTAGVAGGLFATLQSYITPDAFILNLGLYFFVSIIIGGRGVIIGPFIGAVVLAAIPEAVGSLQRYGTFFYGLILLAVVLLMPGGFGEAIARVRARFGRKPHTDTAIRPDLARLRQAISAGP